jgi:hypothetical protein
MRVNGACHCGAIRIEAVVDEAQVAICHCTDCQVLSGSPFRTVAFASRDSMVVHGTPKTYVKVADSGRRRAQNFCTDCGTPLYAADADSTEGVVSLRTGFLAQRGQLVPRLQIWRCSAEPWVDDLSAITTHARQEPLDALRADPRSARN